MRSDETDRAMKEDRKQKMDNTTRLSTSRTIYPEDVILDIGQGQYALARMRTTTTFLSL